MIAWLFVVLAGVAIVALLALSFRWHKQRMISLAEFNARLKELPIEAKPDGGRSEPSK